MGRCCALALSLLAAFGLFAPGNYARAADPAFCDAYAAEAKQHIHDANEFKCGFTGPRWQKKGHKVWCLIVDQALAQSESDARTKDVKECMCQWYADQTMVQIAMNIAKKCKFTGARWVDDKKAHYDFCTNMNPGVNFLKGEISARSAALSGC